MTTDTKPAPLTDREREMWEALGRIEAEAMAPIEELDVEATLERIICLARAAIAQATGA